MTRVIAALDDRGLVDRRPHPSDGRQIIVSLSEAGHRLIADEMSARDAWLAEQLAALPEMQLRVLQDAVVIMNEIVAESD